MKDRYRLNELISKWTIHTDVRDNLSQNIMNWVKKVQPSVIISKKKNPIKVKEIL